MSNVMQVPRASPAKAAYHLSQLRKLFPRASDEQFLQMVWAVDALSSGRPEHAARLLNFPVEATNQAPGSPYAIHKWELESLLIQLFLAPRNNDRLEGPPLDTSRFGSAADLINRLRKLEDVESAIYLANPDFNVLSEMHRIAQRQFHWQRGYKNLPTFYRYAFMYAQGECGRFFENTYGMAITDFNFVGFALFAQGMSSPWISRRFAIPDLGLSEELLNQVVELLLIPAAGARAETVKVLEGVNARHGRPIPTAFLPSILRRFPLVGVDGRPNHFIAPIPEVLLMRVTSGLYYDLIQGGQALLNEANDRFEQYCGAYIDAQMDRFNVRRAYRYEGDGGNVVDTPDLLVSDGDRIALVAECKATKLNYLAQFAEDPFDAERRQYVQMANGVLQLWRFFSHVRRGILHEAVHPDTSAMVLTLDSFLTMSHGLREKVINQANELADQQGIDVEDRRYVTFCPIQGLEEILSVANEDDFLATMRSAPDEKYAGWELREVNRHEAEAREPREPKKFPFKLDGLLPWWDRLQALTGRRA